MFAIECICADSTKVEPLIIFKGQNVIQSWIPQEVINKWYFSTNTKGWISNLHGLEWLKRVFEPYVTNTDTSHAMAEKVIGRQKPAFRSREDGPRWISVVHP